jgi:small redox-active disulfide protein 2
MKDIKVLGTGCAKCNTTYEAVKEAMKRSGIDANLEKIEDIEVLMEYNVLVTPVLMVDGKQVVKGRVPDVNEIIEFLKA